MNTIKYIIHLLSENETIILNEQEFNDYSENFPYVVFDNCGDGWSEWTVE